MSTMHTFTESHSLLREAVRRFVKSEVEPQAEHHDKIGELNLPLLKKCAELGLFGVTVSEE